MLDIRPKSVRYGADGAFVSSRPTGLVLRGVVRLGGGQVRLKGRTVRRAEQPGAFSVGGGLLVSPGVDVALAGAFWLAAA